MQINLQRQPVEAIESDALVLLVFQDRREDRMGLGELFDAGEIAGKPFEMTLLHNLPGMRAKRRTTCSSATTPWPDDETGNCASTS